MERINKYLGEKWEYIKAHPVFSKVASNAIWYLFVAIGGVLYYLYGLFTSRWTDIADFFVHGYIVQTWELILFMLAIPVVQLIVKSIARTRREKDVEPVVKSERLNNPEHFQYIPSVPSPTPDYLKYTESTFNSGYIVRWTWEKEILTKKYYPSDFTFHCKVDKCRIVGNLCPVCKTPHLTPRPNDETLTALIAHRIETGDWKSYAK